MDKALAASRILEKALPHVPFDGWSDGLLKRACLEAGLPESAWYRVFPAGAADAADAFLKQADRAVEAYAQTLNLEEMKIRERIATLVRARLDWLLPHREAVRRTRAFFMLPSHAPRGLRALCRTADTLWYAAGDQSTDFNYYTKRLMLAGIYAGTLQVWLDDESPGQQDSWEFLARRIENVMQFEKAKKSAMQWAQKRMP